MVPEWNISEEVFLELRKWAPKEDSLIQNEECLCTILVDDLAEALILIQRHQPHIKVK